jgi:hypothetical protein
MSASPQPLTLPPKQDLLLEQTQETFEKNLSRKLRTSSFWITLITGAL